jgi:hypothetical protein
MRCFILRIILILIIIAYHFPTCYAVPNGFHSENPNPKGGLYALVPFHPAPSVGVFT